jgi:GNAT superfamily N-acetyltransferase
MERSDPISVLAQWEPPTKTSTLENQTTPAIAGKFVLVCHDRMDDEYYHLLKQKLREYNRRTALQMEPAEAVPLNISVEDEDGQIIGGIAALTYWGWLVIKLLVLDDEFRGNGIGQQLIEWTHAEARRRGCTRSQTTTYDFQALTFYQRYGYRIVGELTDYPDGYSYYWLCKELEEEKK